MTNKKHRSNSVKETTLDAVQPYVIIILTGSLPTATVLASIGQLLTATVCATGGCVGALLLVITAKIIDTVRGRQQNQQGNKE